MADKDVCDICGSATWGEGHFAIGKLWCAPKATQVMRREGGTP
jgi:hypothetical protein